MNLYQYTAYSNPLGAKKIVNHYGELAVRRPDILSRQLAKCVTNHGKEALLMICSIHPDLELINQYTEHRANKEADELKKTNPFLSADGEKLIKDIEEIKSKSEEKKVEPTQKNEKAELLMILGFITVSLAIIMKK
jgi:hypothetical protein